VQRAGRRGHVGETKRAGRRVAGTAATRRKTNAGANALPNKSNRARRFFSSFDRRQTFQRSFSCLCLLLSSLLFHARSPARSDLAIGAKDRRKGPSQAAARKAHSTNLFLSPRARLKSCSSSSSSSSHPRRSLLPSFLPLQNSSAPTGSSTTAATVTSRWASTSTTWPRCSNALTTTTR